MPPSLLFCLHALETIVRVPVANHTCVQFRSGALPLLERLAKRQRAGEMEVTLLYPHGEFTGIKLFEPVMNKFPEFKLVCGANSIAGRMVIERHWREQALDLEAQNSLRLLVAGAKKNVVELWYGHELLLLPPFVALTKQQRDQKRKERRDQRLLHPTGGGGGGGGAGDTSGADKNYSVDNTLKNLESLLDDALSSPETPITDVLKTSALVNKVHFPLMGHTFMLSAN